MEFFIKIITSLQRLSKKEIERLIMIALASTAFLMGTLIYFIYKKSSSFVVSIKKIETIANKAVTLMHDYEKIQKEEDRITDILEKQKEFKLRTYFEQFCKEQNISPTPGWDTQEAIINPKFDEITLQAEFKDQTTQKLIKILEELDKREIIYIKELKIKTEKEKQRISFEIIIATKKSK